jgi:serine/threonine protein kinase
MTDFGLARDIFRDNDESEVGRAVGTPLYMSPEQCDGDEGDSRSDVYSLAATYYVALTRHPPYEGRNTEEVMDRHRYDPQPDPRRIVPTLPAAVFRVIEKAMDKEPDQRYQTAGEMLSGLEGLDFASLDPKAALSLDTVSAQIGTVTPEVGSHVGAVMRSAVRRAGRSASGSRVPSSSAPSRLKWWVLVGVIVILACVAAIILAISLAGMGIAFFVDTSKNEHPPIVEPLESPGTGPQPPTSTDGTGSSVKSPKDTDTTTDAPKDAPAVRPETTPEQPEKTSAEQEKENLAAARLKTAEEYEKSAWTSNPSRVIEVYQEIVTYFPGTAAAKKATEAITRLQTVDTQPPADVPPMPEAPPAESDDGAGAPTTDDKPAEPAPGDAAD